MTRREGLGLEDEVPTWMEARSCSRSCWSGFCWVWLIMKRVRVITSVWTIDATPYSITTNSTTLSPRSGAQLVTHPWDLARSLCRPESTCYTMQGTEICRPGGEETDLSSAVAGGRCRPAHRHGGRGQEGQGGGHGSPEHECAHRSLDHLSQTTLDDDLGQDESNS